MMTKTWEFRYPNDKYSKYGKMFFPLITPCYYHQYLFRKNNDHKRDRRENKNRQGPPIFKQQALRPSNWYQIRVSIMFTFFFHRNK